VTVITNISLEHQEYLGHTIKEITGEKAGIIKSGCPVITAVTQDDALDVIKEKCKSVRAPLYLISELYTYEETCRPRESIPKPLVFKEEAIVHPIKIRRMGIHCLTVTPPLLGHFQIQNTLIVLEVIQRLRDMGLRITDKAIKNGLSQTIWPGRMQIISRKPYLVLDGAHNPSAAKKLVKAIRIHFDYENLILVLGILKDKDVIGICRAIVPLARHIFLSAPQSDRSASAEMLYQMIQSNGLAEESQMVIVPNLADAISQAKALASEKDLILVTGSLYTIGEIMMHLGINPFQKKVEKAVPNMT
jgi:dihydrofolate synthase/folylpolyglutamate synthase